MIRRQFLKMKSKAPQWQRDALWNMGIGNSFYRNARGARIITYHGICLEDHTRFNNIFLKLETFKAHMDLYRKYFNVLSLDDYYAQQFSNDKYNVCLTFDDGFANNYKYVLPLLEEYKLPATFFITAIRDAGYDILWNDFLGIISRYGPQQLTYKQQQFRKNKWNKYISIATGRMLNEVIRDGDFDAKTEMMNELASLVNFKANKQEEDYWLQMTTEQIKQLSQSPYATIGAHGYYHNDLARISLCNAAKEMVRSKAVLENIIQREVKALAFPYGTYTRNVVEVAKQVGYSQLLSLDFLFTDDHSDLAMRERFTVNPFISANNQMHANITRQY